MPQNILTAFLLIFILNFYVHYMEKNEKVNKSIIFVKTVTIICLKLIIYNKWLLLKVKKIFIFPSFRILMCITNDLIKFLMNK